MLQGMVDGVATESGRVQFDGSNVSSDIYDEGIAMCSQPPEPTQTQSVDMSTGQGDEDALFPLMQLPPEIRNEIYRACLTRPYNILLSRKEQPQKSKPKEAESLVTMDEGDAEEPGSNEDAVDRTEGDSGAEDDYVFIGSAERVASAQAQASSSSARSTVSNVRSNFLSRPSRLASRSARPIRSQPSSSSSATAGATNSTINTGFIMRPPTSRANHPRPTAPKREPVREPRPQDDDPLLVNILCVSKQVHLEARSIMYGENMFELDLYTACPTILALHQRSRRCIKHVEVTIPGYNEILEKFQETVRLSLRYCWELQKLVIHMPFLLPGADGSGTTGNTMVYANGFDILRWLPKECEVVLKGNVCAEIEAVVSKNATLAKTLDEVRYAKFQLSMQT